MSIRVTICFLFVLFFALYAWRNWFVSLCALIFLMAFIQHPDMPGNIGGIQGLNPWNFLFLNVFLAWFVRRHREGLFWDMPPYLSWLMLVYCAVVLLAAVRFMFADGRTPDMDLTYIMSENIINCVKWPIPALILYDGCRSRQRIQFGLVAIVLLYFFLAVQVIRYVPLSAASGDEGMTRIAAKLVQNEVGYNRVTLSMMLGGASWAALCCLVLVRSWKYRLGLLGVGSTIMLAQALTGGRSGYLGWLVVGLALSLVRWRKLLLVIPVVLILVATFLPAVRDRFTQGFGEKSGNIVEQRSDYEMTSGRNLAWPLVIDKIGDSPIFGYGRNGMFTTGLDDYLLTELGESFPHPHNAYLEILLDNGIIGFVPVVLFYFVVLWLAFRLLLDRDNPLCTAVGGVACALVLALLTGAMGGQTFYPREGSVGMWAAIGLMLRVSVEQARSRATGQPLFGESEEESIIDLPEDSPEPA